MQDIRLEFPATGRVRGQAHVGVVSSGDLEVLMRGSEKEKAIVDICTSVSGYTASWEATLQRFFSRADVLLSIQINDFGATPGMVLLRLEQALEQMERVHD